MPFWALFSLGDLPVSTAPIGSRRWKAKLCCAVTTAVIKVLSDMLQSDHRALTATPCSWARLIEQNEPPDLQVFEKWHLDVARAMKFFQEDICEKRVFTAKKSRCKLSGNTTSKVSKDIHLLMRKVFKGCLPRCRRRGSSLRRTSARRGCSLSRTCAATRLTSPPPGFSTSSSGLAISLTGVCQCLQYSQTMHQRLVSV